jgi:hypothetical protein
VLGSLPRRCLLTATEAPSIRRSQSGQGAARFPCQWSPCTWELSIWNLQMHPAMRNNSVYKNISATDQVTSAEFSFHRRHFCIVRALKTHSPRQDMESAMYPFFTEAFLHQLQSSSLTHQIHPERSRVEWMSPAPEAPVLSGSGYVTGDLLCCSLLPPPSVWTCT